MWQWTSWETLWSCIGSISLCAFHLVPIFILHFTVCTFLGRVEEVSLWDRCGKKRIHINFIAAVFLLLVWGFFFFFSAWLFNARTKRQRKYLNLNEMPVKVFFFLLKRSMRIRWGCMNIPAHQASTSSCLSTALKSNDNNFFFMLLNFITQTQQWSAIASCLSFRPIYFDISARQYSLLMMMFMITTTVDEIDGASLILNSFDEWNLIFVGGMFFATFFYGWEMMKEN